MAMYVLLALRYLNNVGACMCDNSECTWLFQFFRVLVLLFTPWIGLPRKKAAGKSFRDPLHGSLFFGDQCAVDEHVAAHEAHGKQYQTDVE